MAIEFKSFYVNSYPRSGNTWFRLMLIELLKPKIVDVNPKFKNFFGLSYTKDRNKGLDKIFREGGSIIKSHGKYDFCHPKIPVIYLVRDGRDSLYSYYHYNIDHHNCVETWDEFYERYAVQRKMNTQREKELDIFMGNWSENFLSYADREKVYVIKFEELKENTFNCIKSALDFTGIDFISEEAINSVIKDFEEKLKIKKELHDRPRAETGGWKKNFSDKQNIHFLDIHYKALEKLGYETYPFR